MSRYCGLDEFKHYRGFAACQYRFRVENGALNGKPTEIKESMVDHVGRTPLPCDSSYQAGAKGEAHPDSGKTTGEDGDGEFSYLTKFMVAKEGQKGFANMFGRTIPWVFLRFRFELNDGLLDTKFEDGASNDPNGPDAKDYSLVPALFVYMRYYDLYEEKMESLSRKKTGRTRPSILLNRNPSLRSPICSTVIYDHILPY